METKMWLNSSQVTSTHYVPTTKDLIVVYKSNQTSYKYKDVPKEVWDKLISSESVGSFINKEIKGKYEYVKL